EITATDDSTKRLLFGLIGAQAGQAAEAVLELDARDPIDRAFVDPDALGHGTLAMEHPFGRVANGPMVRVCHAKRAIEARGYFADGEVVMRIEGEGTLEMAVKNGRAKTRTTRKKPHLSLDRAGLASLLFGASAPSEGAPIGLFRLHDAASRLDAIFTLPPFFGLDPF
ncbi:MAG: sterol carrier protein domain-containing protein, partial [Polyangiaceae bacterium]